MSIRRKLGLLHVYCLCFIRCAAGIIKGISYSPLPLTSSAGIGDLYQDDWMVQEAKPMWGERGRQDLHVISQLGANMVRLYGNNPELNHRDFLDIAHKEGLQVSPGFSDYPYFQMPVGNCRATQYNCYNQTRALFASNLQNGFLTSSRTYHPALRYFFLMNEPDLKMPPEALFGSPEAPRTMAKAILSALDGALAAEKDLGVVGDLINFTVSFSFGVCSACQHFADKPALGQIATLEDAIFHPESYGYYPNNNLTDAYLKRWTHCFNTNNPARDLRPLFLDIYEATFSSTPFFIGEYHSQYVPLPDDLGQVLTLAATSSLFLGISFFEYQVAYWKGGSEEGFGLFGLGDYSIASMPYFGGTYDVWCLVPIKQSGYDKSLPAIVAKAYGGPYLEEWTLCVPSPAAVPLTWQGFKAIASQQVPERMATFAARVVRQLGAVVIDQKGLHDFASQFIGRSGKKFGDLVTSISFRPPWTRFSIRPLCVADRLADAGQVGAAISWICGNTSKFNCSDAPQECKLDAFKSGDWVFGRFYASLDTPDPFNNCYFDGSAVYASPEVFHSWDTSCTFASSTSEYATVAGSDSNLSELQSLAVPDVIP